MCGTQYVVRKPAAAAAGEKDIQYCMGAKGGESDFFSLSPSSHDWLCVAHGALRGERRRLPVSNEDEAVVKKTTNQNPKEEEDSFFSWRRLWVFWFLEMHQCAGVVSWVLFSLPHLRNGKRGHRFLFYFGFFFLRVFS